MRVRGTVSGLLMGKVVVLFAVLMVLGSMLTFYDRFDETTRKEKLRGVLDVVVDSLRAADSLPGRVRLERDLPSVKGTYEIFISTETGERGLVKVGIREVKGLEEYFFISRPVFPADMARVNPQKILVSKAGRLSVEVI